MTGDPLSFGASIRLCSGGAFPTCILTELHVIHVHCGSLIMIIIYHDHVNVTWPTYVNCHLRYQSSSRQLPGALSLNVVFSDWHMECADPVGRTIIFMPLACQRLPLLVISLCALDLTAAILCYLRMLFCFLLRLLPSTPKLLQK